MSDQQQQMQIETSEDEVEMTLDNIEHPACQSWLGLYAKMSLTKFGSAVFVVGEDGGIRQVNPTGVFFVPGADDVPPEGKVVWKRPIVTQPQVRWVAWRDGEPWEIEFEPDSKPTSI